ncbi:MAG: helix-turn-helix domain-containing protein [Chloroflexi bacterium]|nr:helix-turn-helix domain-containing protein [Chloroflexota bacterium]
MNETFPEIMTISEISIYLRIARSSIYKLAQDGKIPCQKVGRHWRFRREAVDRWLEASFPAPNHKVNPAAVQE